MEETAATPSGVATVQKVVMYQSRYWRCLYPKDNERGRSSSFTIDLSLIPEGISSDLGAERMHGKFLLSRNSSIPLRGLQMLSGHIRANTFTIRIR